VRLPVDTKLDFAAQASKQQQQANSQPFLTRSSNHHPTRSESPHAFPANPGRFGSPFPKKGRSDWV
jgi:hypothetical protein